MGCTITLIQHLEVIQRDWNFIAEGMDQVFDKTNGDQTLQGIYNDLITGALSLWVVRFNGNYAGFMTTRILQPLQGDKYMLIQHGYSNHKFKAFSEALGLLAEQAKFAGCKTIRFFTLDEQGFKKRLVDKEWHKGYVEFIKEVY